MIKQISLIVNVDTNDEARFDFYYIPVVPINEHTLKHNEYAVRISFGY